MNPSTSAQNPISQPLKKANPSSHFTLSRPSIQIDSSAVNPAGDEAFAKVQAELPDINHTKPMLKMKVDTGAQGNILSDDNGLPTDQHLLRPN